MENPPLLPQLSGGNWITDGGQETTLIFKHGIDLPCLAAFVLLKDDKGTETLNKYYMDYVNLALKYQVGIILESATWRANPDWAVKLGIGEKELVELNMKSIEMLRKIRDKYQNKETKMVLSGLVGPRADGYKVGYQMTVDEAMEYHLVQIKAFKEGKADMVGAYTLNYLEEAVGITKAAQLVGIPIVISFTLETDGRLPSGITLEEAITGVDKATANGPVYYALNCVHPVHCKQLFKKKEPWVSRLKEIRANSSTKSHAELDESTTLDEGDPVDLGNQCKIIKELTGMNIIGGCCGTDAKHIEQICLLCFPS